MMPSALVLTSMLAGMLPGVVWAHPLDPPTFALRAAEPEGDPTDPTSPAAEEPPFQPTSSKAPDSATTVPPPAETPAPQPEVKEPPPGDPAADNPDGKPLSLHEERGHARTSAFNRHGIGVRGGITVVPTWILARYLDTHGNALCRGESIGNFAATRGLLKTKGCNFYTALEYVYRQSRILDIVGVAGYQRLHTPDAMWLDKGQAAINGVGGADYTEVKMDILVLEADFIARAPIVVRDNVEFGIGGGGGLGLGVVFGGVWQTALGDGPAGYKNGTETANSCQTTADLADFNRCTPRFDPTEKNADPDFNPNDLSHPNAQGYATCGKDHCNTHDLNLFGYRKKNGDLPPVIPIVNLALSARLIIKDVFGITLTGGWNTGFYFGGSLNYFFGKSFQTDRPTGPAPAK
ncbi:MAG: hypothetical protein U0168_15790 [Nannocystaceae bacterium]